MSAIVIVGGGLAAAKAAEALREQGFDGDVVLLGAEDHLPYERPPLSKEFFVGKKTAEDCLTFDADWYRDNKIDVRPGTQVKGIDPTSKTVTLPDDSTIEYQKLLLATGSRSRHLGIPGEEADGVHHVRTIDDAAALRDVVGEGTRLAIVGAGWIGLEIAASSRERGAEVAIAEYAEQPLLRVMGSEVGKVFADLHRAHGVDLRLGVSVDSIIVEDGKARGIKLGDGSVLDADAVLVAAGAIPNLEVAEAAGLDVEGGGVVASAGLQSSNSDIFVAGDIANADNPTLGKRVRVEHWANAQNQPATAVTNMLGGSAEYTNLPYFFTDQYDLGMEYAGLADGNNRVVLRGDVAGREFVAFWLDDESRVLAGMQVNIWDQLDHIKALITGKKPVDAAKLADPAIPLGDLT